MEGGFRVIADLSSLLFSMVIPRILAPGDAPFCGSPSPVLSLSRMKHLISCLLIAGTVGLCSCKKNNIIYITNGIAIENFDNSGTLLRPATGTVESDGYVLRINYESDQTAFNAVDDEHRYQPGNKPTSILVTALQPFDSTHPAGTSLNGYFINGPGTGSTCERILEEFPYTDDFNPTHVPDDLWLMVPPDNSGPFRFVVEMHFDNGIIARDTTTSVNLVQ